MVRATFVSALVWSAGLAVASVASPGSAPPVSVQIRNFPGKSDEFTLHELYRRLAALAHERRDNVFNKSMSLDKSWDDATLFSHSFAPNTTSNEGLEIELGIEVTCVTCYLKAGATVELTVNGEFDIGGRIQNITEQLGDEMKNMTLSAAESVGNILEGMGEEILDIFDPDDDFDIDDLIDLNDFEIDTDFDIQLAPLPEIQLLFQIDHLDLYMEIDTTIKASTTLTIPLYQSQTAFGIAITENMEIGLFVTMDLILSAEGEITLRSGFHILFDDPIGFNLAMFSSEVSDMIFNGAKFEFLPVTVISGSIALKAILRVGLHAGFEISNEVQLGFFLSPLDALGVSSVERIKELATVHAGVEVGVFATVAEFLTNVTGGVQQAADEGCALKIVEEYTMALGAAAGATLALGGHTWGPQPNTTIPIFYTTLADICAITADAHPTPTNNLAARQEEDDPNLETQTISTTVHYTGVACITPGLNPCPASLQTTTLLTSTKTRVTAVPPGVEATFPPSTALAVASTIPFRGEPLALSATSGAPVSYVPPPPPPTTSAGEGGGVGDDVEDFFDDVGDVFKGETGGVSNKLIIGLSVGLGVPFLAAVIGGLVYWMRRQRYASVPKSDTAVEYTGRYESPMAAEREGMMKKGPAAAVGEVQH